MSKERFTLKMYYDDMGSFTQPGCTDLTDALWHVNSARAHDGLKPMTIEKLKALLLFRGHGSGWAKRVSE